MLKFEDITTGMELKGTVLNVVPFGAFVDIGLKESGLVHISQMANRYIKSPYDVVAVGDVITVWVMEVKPGEKKISLSMIPSPVRASAGTAAAGSEVDRSAANRNEIAVPVVRRSIINSSKPRRNSRAIAPRFSRAASGRRCNSAANGRRSSRGKVRDRASASVAADRGPRGQGLRSRLAGAPADPPGCGRSADRGCTDRQ